ncbi:hypothetical protein NDU88_006328 [Pleurodeles waltl]|uniref:Uncharacterized protein n=1 Tax=Pleurodeles waltl TaxID=8319 RepID=A0AAV7MBW4_PLEWA|nr:hypothetical protein NDU88_006328 [Pleurodeles waltl]
MYYLRADLYVRILLLAHCCLEMDWGRHWGSAAGPSSAASAPLALSSGRPPACLMKTPCQEPGRGCGLRVRLDGRGSGVGERDADQGRAFFAPTARRNLRQFTARTALSPWRGETAASSGEEIGEMHGVINASSKRTSAIQVFAYVETRRYVKHCPQRIKGSLLRDTKRVNDVTSQFWRRKESSKNKMPILGQKMNL